MTFKTLCKSWWAVALIFGTAGGNFSVWGKEHKDGLDRKLRQLLHAAHVHALDAGPSFSAEKVLLGQALFFDKILGGNMDMACATCHHPLFATGDGLSLSIGTGGLGLGPDRALGSATQFIPRNAPEIFNRGSYLWQSQFWDSRVEIGRHGQLLTPAGDALPDGLESVLAAQAMFPVTSREEMRGFPEQNELGAIDETDPAQGLPAIWDALMVRLEDAGYLPYLQAAYPGVPVEDLGFEHAANAIAAFESTAFTFLDSPFDDYLSGNSKALTDQEKRGATLFYGKAKCAQCHSGSLLTDQLHYNIGVPQLGPGKLPEAPLDFGRARETYRNKDIYAFRTPPLRNVAVTGPWMHDGAFTTLPGAVEHHLNAGNSLLGYDASQLDTNLQSLVVSDLSVLAEMLQTLDGKIKKRKVLTEEEFDDLIAFLISLTSRQVLEGLVDGTGPLIDAIPASVPSGLPVD